jgi:hypothetical protein
MLRDDNAGGRPARNVLGEPLEITVSAYVLMWRTLVVTGVAWTLVLPRVDKETENSFFTERFGGFEPV